MTEMHSDLDRILVSSEAIQARVKEFAAQIVDDYKDIERLYIVGILKGAFMFMADLTRELSRLEFPHVVDFMAVSSYGKTVSSGEVRIVMDLREPIKNRHVLLVEDIVDTGNTLDYLYRVLEGRKPASVRTAALVRKVNKGGDAPLDYLGFEIPDVWVVGYGLDYAELYRTLPYVAELKSEIYMK